MRKVVIALSGLALAAAASGVHAYVQKQLAVRAELQTNKSTIVDQLATALETYFLFPEIGRKYAATLRSNLASGAYNRFSDPAEFTEVITGELQAIYPDGHLRLRAPRPPSILPSPSTASAESPNAPPETGIEHALWLTPGVAYIAFELFPGTDESLGALRRELDRLGSAKTLIVDARTHGGGYTEEIDLLASYLYGEETQLAVLETRAAADRERPDTATHNRIDAPPGLVRRAHVASPSPKATALRRAEVFLLTSGYTGSAAEHLAWALKRTGRGTLIGETTAGLGHYGKIVDLPAGFTAFIPIGRTFDPQTGEGWEGVGVEPHIAVPAAEALRKALVASGIRPDAAEKIAAPIKLRGTMERQVPLRKPPPQD